MFEEMMKNKQTKRKKMEERRKTQTKRKACYGTTCLMHDEVTLKSFDMILLSHHVFLSWFLMINGHCSHSL